MQCLMWVPFESARSNYGYMQTFCFKKILLTLVIVKKPIGNNIFVIIYLYMNY